MMGLVADCPTCQEYAATRCLGCGGALREEMKTLGQPRKDGTILNKEVKYLVCDGCGRMGRA
jgi:hypothetical protein